MPETKTATRAARPYRVWYRYHGQTEWLESAHIIMAASNDHARTKMLRKFRGARFSWMSLVAYPYGFGSPNDCREVE